MVLIPSFIKIPFLQIQLLVFLTIIYHIWYFSHLPHSRKPRLLTELYNETLITLIQYHLLTFTDFVPDLQIMYSIGISFGCFSLLLMVTHIALLLTAFIDSINLRNRLLRRRKQYWVMVRQMEKDQLVNEEHMLLNANIKRQIE